MVLRHSALACGDDIIWRRFRGGLSLAGLVVFSLFAIGFELGLEAIVEWIVLGLIVFSWR